MDANLSESLDQAEKFAEICDLDESLAAKVKDLEATEPIQDGQSRELVAALQDIEELEEELRIEKLGSAKLERGLEMCKSEQQTTEQTDIAQLRPEKDMPLHQVENLVSEKSILESELRGSERIIPQLIANQVPATPEPNITQPRPGQFGIRGFSHPASGSFGIRGSPEPAPGQSGQRGFSVKSSTLSTYQGKQTLDDITAFLFALEGHFKNATQAFGWVGITGWGEQAVLQQKGYSAVCDMHRFPLSTSSKWSTFGMQSIAKFISSNALYLVKREWEELGIKRGDGVTECNKRFGRQHWKLNPDQPMPAEMLADAYEYKIGKGNQGVYMNLVPYSGMRDRTPTREQRMKYLTVFDTSLN